MHHQHVHQLTERIQGDLPATENILADPLFQIEVNRNMWYATALANKTSKILPTQHIPYRLSSEDIFFL